MTVHAREQAGVVVVGAGAAGLAAARELARDGLAPIVLERFELGHRRGSSHGTSRIVRLAHDRVEDVREAIEAYALWRTLERETATQLLVQTGGLDFGDLIGPTVAALRECDIGFELLEPSDVQRRFPAVAARGQVALFQPDAAIGLADVTLEVLASDALRHGAQIRSQTVVTGLRQDAGGVEVQTSSGTISAGCVVLAAGGWIGELAASAGVDLAVRATLQTAVHLRLAGAPVGSVPTVVEQDETGRVFYSVPSPQGGEVKGGWHDPGPPAELDGDREPDEAFAVPFREWAAGRYVGLGEQTDAYGCIYTWLPGDRFHLARHDRVVVVSCCSGRAFKFTPRIGVRAAALAREALGLSVSDPR